MAAPAAPVAAGGGFFGWIKNLFGGAPAPAPAPATEAKTAELHLCARERELTTLVDQTAAGLAQMGVNIVTLAPGQRSRIWTLDVDNGERTLVHESAETLYEQAGILDRRSGNPDTVAAIRAGVSTGSAPSELPSR